MKLALIGAACLAASALSGCAEVKSFVDDPGVQQFAATVATVAKAVPCDVSAASVGIKALADQLKTKQSAAGTLYAVSTAVCVGQLQGRVISTTPVANVQAVTTVTAVATPAAAQ